MGSQTQQAPTRCLQTSDKNSRTREWLAGWVKTDSSRTRRRQPATLGACPRMKTSPRTRWPRSGPACWNGSSGELRRRGGGSSGRRPRRSSGGRRPRGEAEPSPRTSAPGNPATCLTASISSVRRLAQEVAPSPPAPTAPTASAATPAPAARAPAEEEVGPRRGEFTRLEYERRAQLKLMDDLDKVLRPRAAGSGGPGRGGRRAPRPRSGCCDDSALARSPARGLLGEAPWGHVGQLGVHTQGCSVGDQGFQKDMGATAG